MTSYPTLLSPFTLGSVTIRNRTLMAAMSSGLSDPGGRVSEAQIAYYAERSRGGVGLIAVEFACIDSSYGVSEERQLVFDDDAAIPGHARLVAAIRAGGATPALQLQAPGQFAVPREGHVAVAPSNVLSRRDDSLRARALIGAEIVGLIASFREAARRALLAGYEAIELHGAHGYLLMAFLSPLTNQRDDEWGGDEERRLAFPIAVIRAIKDAIGDVPLLYRISADDFAPGGLGIEDMARITPRLVAAGLDGIDVSTGSLTGSLERTIDPMSKEGWRFEMTRRIRDAVDVPVAGIGSRTPETAESALLREDMDLVALGRPLLADAHWVAKAAQGRSADIRPCTSCNWCADRVFKHLPTGCAENPRTGRETVPLITENVGHGRRIVIIGGGPGGLAAAVQAESIGFTTTLFESENRLGGGIITSAAPPHKDNLLWYRDYLERRLAASEVDVRVGSRATLDDVLALDPFAVIQAQGTVPTAQAIPGDDLAHVVSAYDLLLDRGPTPESWRGPVVVYGGGETGCETAELIAARGLDVVLISRSDEYQLARAAEPLYRKVLLTRLRANPHVSIRTGTHVLSIDRTGVTLNEDAGTTHITAAMIVIAQGRRSDDTLAAELAEHGITSILIGDARQISRIGEAVHDANTAIRELVGSAADAPPA
ncbi:FAD-dependent oxidoreductase [Microbacterium sp. A93]|uniref:oxidoreductase n=1 Tax=Microbacterium sp. A93 TaxID=3450716 RepID=UPI003F438E0B